MTRDEIIHAYSAYIACLNDQDWSNLHRYIANEVRYNGQLVGLTWYQSMLIGDFDAIPDLTFNVERFACDPPIMASRLAFDCTPRGLLFGIPVNGKQVQFTENVFYEFGGGRIVNVWSIIDKAGIAAQI